MDVKHFSKQQAIGLDMKKLVPKSDFNKFAQKMIIFEMEIN